MALQPAADFGPQTMLHMGPDRDATQWLPPAAAARLTALHQRVTDAYAILAPSDVLRELYADTAAHDRRIAELTNHPGMGGKGLSDDAPQVQDEKRKLDRVNGELQRLKSLDEIRSARWQIAGQLSTHVDAWLISGIPSGTQLVEVEVEPPELRKGEAIPDAVERNRRRLRELAADLHRIRSAPYLSSAAKAKAREQIDRLADAAEPDCSRTVELLEPVAFVTTTVRSDIHNAPGGAVAFSEVPDSIGLMCWLFRDQIITKIETEIDAVADDANALDEKTRAEMEATILADALATERQEAALIWHAETQGAMIDFRKNADPRAVLGVALIVVPRPAGDAMLSPGSSPQWAAR